MFYSSKYKYRRKLCPICNRSFYTKRKDKKYCCYSCYIISQKSYKERNRLSLEEYKKVLQN